MFGMKDFLGSVTLSCEDIRRCSALDAPQWYQLQGTKTGSVEVRVKVISDMETEVSCKILDELPCSIGVLLLCRRF